MSTSNEEIVERFNDFLLSCKKICKSTDEEKQIKKAFDIAWEVHRGEKSWGGEPYILHLLDVSEIIVKEIGLGAKSVISSLLNDITSSSEYSIEDIEQLFGNKIATMVESLARLSGIVESKDVCEQAENFKKIILTLTDDIRVVIIKIADRLSIMRKLQYQPVQRQTKLISDTLSLFAPLAHRLGLFAIKSELEDLSLKFLHPNEYSYIQRKIEDTTSNRNDTVEQFIQPIKKNLSEAGYKYEITSRVKSVYSIWRKMNSKSIPFEEVYDLFAIRIIFTPTSDNKSEIEQCFKIHHILTQLYREKPDRLRNWVESPKPNGYEALHCTLMDPASNHWIEVQVRSKRMDDIAELGFAAHWSYKTNEKLKDNKDVEFESWLAQLRETLNNPTKDPVEFLENFQQHLQVESITVFTPKGEAKNMPRKSTVLDFAYAIHTNIGNKAIGAKVNYKLSTLYSELKPGDQIEIITSESGEPKEEWLHHVTTAKAKNRIKSFLVQSNETDIVKGQKIFEQLLAEKSIPMQGRLFVKLLPAFSVSTKEMLYIKLSKNEITKEQIFDALRSSTSTKSVKYWTLKILSLGSYNGKKQNVYSQIPGLITADCCNPIPGDDVIGIKNNDGIVVVHRKDCPSTLEYITKHSADIVDVKWSEEKVMSYLSSIEFNGLDRSGVVMDLAKIIVTEFNINIRDIEIHSHDGIYEGKISFYVRNQETLNAVIDKINSIDGMEKVNRVVF